jgi:single-stranded DNA-binding protein
MALPVVHGRGFLLSEGVELKYSKNGNAYARLPLACKNNKKNPDGTWVSDKEIVIEGTVFGHLAESLCEIVTTRQEIAFSAELYVEEYQGKKYVKANVLSAWPTREERTPVAAGKTTVASHEADLPF